jgi:hypothetical protein
MTSARTFIASLLVAGGLVTAAWERKALDEARRERSSLAAAQEESERLLAENAELSSQHEASASRAAASPELLRLRNEVRQLRTLAPEADRLRAENLRLAALPAPASSGPKFSELEGYVAKENWSESGLATPEAAVQTFFRAVRDLDLPRLVSCLSQRGGLAMGIRTNATNGQLHPDSQEALRFLGLINGFRIEEKDESRPGQVTLGIRAASGGQLLRLKLGRVGTEWKIDGDY